MTPRFRRLLVPIDFSPWGRRAVRIAAGLAGEHGTLVLLHVVPQFANRVAQRAVLDDAARRLVAFAARIRRRGRGPRVETRVESGDPYRRIAEAARSADAVVMCTLGRTGLPHLVIGSVAERVVRHAPVPVLTFQPPARRRR
jgi:universal stress protein A